MTNKTQEKYDNLKKALKEFDSYLDDYPDLFIRLNGIKELLNEIHSCPKCELCLEHHKNGRTME